MTPLQPVTDMLRMLPKSIRKTLYTILLFVGAALAVCGYLNIDELGPVSLDRAFEVYATLSPFMAAVAVANVNAPDKSAEPVMGEFDEDVDLASFEPVGDSSDVFSESSAFS